MSPAKIAQDEDGGSSKWYCANFEHDMDPSNNAKCENYKTHLFSTNYKDNLDIKSQRQLNIEFFKILSLAHQCDVENLKGDDVFYNGPSPDEVALVEYAASQNFQCTYNSDDIVKLRANFSNKDIEYKFEIYRKMEFNSDRKRMSVLLRDPNDGLIKLLIKGADSIILDRIDKNQLTEVMQ